MSLTEQSLSDVVWKQLAFKSRAFFTTMASLVLLQIVAVLFSNGGTGSSGFMSNHIDINITYYSGDMVALFTLLWLFMLAIYMTTRASRYDDFSFVGTRLSSHLANILLIVGVSVVSGISAALCGYIVKIIGHFQVQLSAGQGLFAAPMEFLLTISTISLYGILVGAIGYAFGMIIQFHRSFTYLLPILLIACLIGTVSMGYDAEVKAIFDFFVLESNFWLFLIKVIVVSGLIFAATIGITNKMEVRK